MDNLATAFSKEIEGKTVLVTGGTGSFGRYVVKELLNYSPGKIIIFSRDEDKQYRMELEFKAGHLDYVPGDEFKLDEEEHYAIRHKWRKDLINFAVGDVRDFERVLEITRGVDVVFHAAALKQVPMSEFHPYEAVKTNILGANNIRLAAIRNNVKKVVAISTDKAVKPVNAMGMTKAIQEKIMLSSEETDFETKFACVRYGNVIGSRGSVIPLFKDKIKKKEPLTVTKGGMTRFLLTLKDAIELVFYAAVHSKEREIFVKKAPACTILDLAKTVAKELHGKDGYPIKEVPCRPGEKIHEVLVSEEEMPRAREEKEHFIIYPHLYFTQMNEQGKGDWFKKSIKESEYTSANTEMLGYKGIVDLLKKAGWL